MKTKKEIFGTVLIVLGTLLLGLCLLLVIHNLKEDEEATDFASTQLPAIKQFIAQSTDKADVEVTDENDGDMPVVVIDGYGYIGYVTFPALDLEMPVMDQYDETRLKLAPCRYYGSLKTDDLVVAGHNYRSGFGMLKNLDKGDEVYFTDMNGVVYYYKVEEIEVLHSTEVTKMVDSGWDFSLYTCSYDRSKRLTIRCAKVES